MSQYTMTIDGKAVTSPETFDALNPATEEVIAKVPSATRKHLEDAVAAAKRAFPPWRDRPLAERQKLVSKLGDLIEARQEDFLSLLTTEQGKARAGAEWEIGGCIAWLRLVAQQSLPDEVISTDGDDTVITRRTPIGVIGGITPWNFPLLLAVWKIAPALVTGNTMVLKPSPYTPLCTLLFGELSRDVLPPGVLNIVSGGNAIGQMLTEHPDVGKISFTGSTETGRKIMSSASGNLKRLTLELGGNDPAIVMPDVDPKAIAKDLFWGSFANSSQFCVVCKRLYVHEDVYDAVARELVAYAKTVKVGNGSEKGVELGPIQNKMQYDKVSNLLADSKKQGHKFLLGGAPTGGKGYFIPVTIVDNPPEDSRVVVEEAFGPVLPMLKWKHVDDVVERANRTMYGLAASVWGKDLKAANAVAARIEAGTVWINHMHVFAPNIAFGGHKQSGVGVENSQHGLSEYTNSQTIMQKKLPA